MKQSPLAHLSSQLAELAANDLLRVPPPIQSPEHPSFCSNDYLGLASATHSDQIPAGAGASRLVTGDTHDHRKLEAALAGWLNVEAALLFSSGYATNLGVVSTLAEPGDLVVSDQLNHASIVDGCRLSRARVAVVPHCDVAAIDRVLSERSEARAWVVSESYFSMDADSPDLVALRESCTRNGAALIVDEAHALGLYGPDGRGICAERGVVPDVIVGTLGKSFGAMGGFVAGSRDLIAWLWNRCRSFVYSTGLSPRVAASALANFQTALGNPMLRGNALANAQRLRNALASCGITPLGFGPIVPWVIGSNSRAMAVSARLAQAGIVAKAIRPPTVPVGQARIRFTVSAKHSIQDIDYLAKAVTTVC